MRCSNHPDSFAVERCTGCSESFCGNCLVNLQGQLYCASCKVMAVPDPGAALSDEKPVYDDARTALILSIVGLFAVFCCFIGAIMEAIGLYKGLEAKRVIDQNPSLGGRDVAIAAIVIGSIGSFFCLLSVAAYMMS